MAKHDRTKVKVKRNEEKACPASSRAIQKDDPYRQMRKNVDLVLSDGIMVFLAIFMIPIILLPIIFSNLSREVTDLLSFMDLFILVIFVIEYFLKLFLAKDRWAHFKNGWHLLDLFIITIPLLELLPIVFAFDPRYSPIVRLLRALRLFAVGGRTVERRVRGTAEISLGPSAVSRLKARAISGTMDDIKEGLTLEQVKGYMHDHEQTWIDITDVSEMDFKALSEVLGVPEALLASKLVKEAYPRIDSLDGSAYLFLQFGHILPATEKKRSISLTTTGQLIICRGLDIITISRTDHNLIEKVMAELRKKSGYGDSFVVTALNGIMDLVIDSYKDITNMLECEIVRLENLPRDEMPKDFLENSFQLKKEVTRFASSLLHLKEVMNEIVTNRVPLEGFDKTWKGLFDIHFDDTAYLFETISNSKENLISLIDLHINITSHETNKVMRVIAVITCIAVIPAMITGMLSMNVKDAPSPFLTWQITTITALLMALVTWAFYKIGWLRS